MHSALDTKCCTLNIICYSIPNVRDVLAAALPFFFTSWIPFQFCISVDCGLSGSMKSGGKDMRLTLWTVRIHVGYLLPSTTVKMLYRLWGNRIDGRISKQWMVSKSVPCHCYCTLSVHNDALERSFNSRLEEMTDPTWARTLSGHPYSYLSHWSFQGAISIY